MTTTFSSSLPYLISCFKTWETPLTSAKDYASGMVLPTLIQYRKLTGRSGYGCGADGLGLKDKCW